MAKPIRSYARRKPPVLPYRHRRAGPWGSCDRGVSRYAVPRMHQAASRLCAELMVPPQALLSSQPFSKTQRFPFS